MYVQEVLKSWGKLRGKWQGWTQPRNKICTKNDIKEMQESSREEETDGIIQMFKNNKISSETAITAQMLKACSDKAREMIWRMMKKVWQDENTSSKLRITLVSPLHKKEMLNYRGKFDMSQGYKKHTQQCGKWKKCTIPTWLDTKHIGDKSCLYSKKNYWQWYRTQSPLYTHVFNKHST